MSAASESNTNDAFRSETVPGDDPPAGIASHPKPDGTSTMVSPSMIPIPSTNIVRGAPTKVSTLEPSIKVPLSMRLICIVMCRNGTKGPSPNW